MLFTRAIPPGEPVSPEEQYTDLDLAALAGEDRPYVVANFVSSADGKATAAGRTAALGGEGDRAAFHLLRTQADALLAGTGTMRVERYGVPIRNERLAGLREREGRPAQPLTAIISRSGAIPFDIPLFADDRVNVALYTPATTTVPECAARITRHEIAADQDDLAGVMRSLRADHGVRSVLCEGGPMLFNSLLRQGLIDELFLTLAPLVTGGDELGITSGPALDELQAMDLVWTLEYEGNLFMRYRRRPPPPQRG
jgi:riboflavin biosynthesis pyrimidine reductase